MLDLLIGFERGGNACNSFERRCISAGFEISSCQGNAQPLAATGKQRRDIVDRPIRASGIVGIMALHDVIGKRKVAGRTREGPDMIEARHKGNVCARDSRP